MANQLQVAGAALPPSDFAPLHVNRQATGLWPNTNPLRDASTPGYVESNYGGKKDSYKTGKNCEVSTRLTLIRRPGLSVYNSQIFPPIKRFYGWNTFTTDQEFVRLMADTAATVYDATGPSTKTAVWTKAAGAGPTFFLGVGNILYMTNGKENIQLNNATGAVTRWGVDAPTTAPAATQQPKPNPYGSWRAATVFGPTGTFSCTIEEISFQNSMRRVSTFGVTGTVEPTWNANPTQPDGSVVWTNMGNFGWGPNHAFAVGTPIVVGVLDASSGLTLATIMWVVTAGTSGAVEPTNWVPGLGSQTGDGTVVWENRGNVLYWGTIGPGTSIVGTPTIVDPNGYLQTIVQVGKTGTDAPTLWQRTTGAYTYDGTAVWKNMGPFSVATTAPVQYGYAAAVTSAGVPVDISNMSPASTPIIVIGGNQVTVQGVGTKDGDTLIIYSTAQGGSTFMQLTTIPNPGAGVPWTYIDPNPGYGQNFELLAQVGGEGTPLPIGASCMTYHLGRIFAAVNNVVYVSSGPDAIASGSSGNAGFDTTFTAQSKIIKFWVTSLGVVVFTVRDSYIVLGSATTDDPLYMKVYIPKMPLLNYDALSEYYSTAYLYGGQRMLLALDPGSGIGEASFPIAPLMNLIDPSAAYCTMHIGTSGETALYLSDGQTLWYRMATTSAPEQGSNWSPSAIIQGGMSALQSTEIVPGTFALLVGPGPGGGPIRARDINTRTDAGTPYPVEVEYNPIVLANPGQLAGLAWMTLKCSEDGNAAALGVLLDELNGTYEAVPRTRQDPTNLPPSESLLSNRHSLLQSQNPVWCQFIKFRLEWPAEDSPDELLTYTIFGQTWQEQRTQ